jgi:hypothetical protein
MNIYYITESNRKEVDIMGGKELRVSVDQIALEGKDHSVYNAASENFKEIAAGVYAKVVGDEIVIWADARKLSHII